MADLLLASASPRRGDLLREAGFTFQVHAANVDEDKLGEGVEPRQLPLVLAEAKAKAASVQVSRNDYVILAADTVVYAADGEVLGKPANEEDARRMITKLADTLHKVVTGFAVRDMITGRQDAQMIKSDVQMRKLAAADIEAYLATGKWQGKAGGYGIQDEGIGSISDVSAATLGGDPFVERLEGELTNVIGLPMPQVIDVLADFGIHPDVS